MVEEGFICGELYYQVQHFGNIEERSCIRKYYADGLSYREITRLIGRNVSTISREIRRNCTHMYDIPTYYPHTAQKKYLLRRNGQSHGRKETRGKYNQGKSIRKRDKSVYSRLEAGHWEADTVVSGQCKSKACFATLTERKTRFYIAVKMPDRRAATMENAIVSALSAFPPQLVKSITCDRGTEFANRRRIEERLHCDVYFADPHCAWQKGANEDLNGLLREF